MFTGSVDFEAQIKGDGLTFPQFDFDPHEPGVQRISIEGPNGNVIRSTVYLDSVASHEEGRKLAEKVSTTALNRIVFHHRISIENARRTGDQFSPINPQQGVHMSVTSSIGLVIGGSATVVLGINPATLKTQLEQVSPPGEDKFGLFRSARLSSSPVEEYMHLYSVLLMIFNDRQADVDTFILSEEPTTPKTQHPLKAQGVMETLYTRLRNELAHRRANVNLTNTKAEMTQHVGKLAMLTKRAIELHP